MPDLHCPLGLAELQVYPWQSRPVSASLTGNDTQEDGNRKKERDYNYYACGHRYAYAYTEIEKEGRREREGGERQTDRQTKELRRERERKAERETDRQTDRLRGREREREREGIKKIF